MTERSKNPAWVASSRLRPPEPHVRLVPRTTLLARLDRSLAKRVTLVCAGAGFGKTTLLSQWRECLVARGVRCAWITFEREDRDPARFFLYLATALTRTLDEQAARELPQASADSSLSALQSIVLRTLECVEHRTVLFFDDYPLVESQPGPLANWFSFLPPAVHIVIATRAQLIPDLANLYVQGLVDELGAADLRMSREEAEELLTPQVPVGAVPDLFVRTEGWPVALQLVSLALRDTPHPAAFIEAFSVSTEAVSSYLTSQVMATVPPRARQALIASSILERFNGDLLVEVAELESAEVVPPMIEPLSALIAPCNDMPGWSRCHPLFREYLHAQLVKQGDKHVRKLHVRAAHWFHSHDLLAQAVRHAASARDFDLAVNMLEGSGGIWIGVRNGKDYLQRLLGILPSEVIDGSLRLRMARAFVWIRDGRSAEALSELHALQRESQRLQDPDIHKDWLILKASGTVHVSDDSMQAEELQGFQQLCDSTGDSVVRGVMDNLLGIMHSRTGSLQAAQDALKRALTYYDHVGVVNPRVWTRTLLGEVHLTSGDLELATSSLRAAETIAQQQMSADTSLLAMIQMLLATVHHYAGDRENARRLSLPALHAVEKGEGYIEFLLHGFLTGASTLLADGGTEDALRLLERGKSLARAWKFVRLERTLEYVRSSTEASVVGGSVSAASFEEQVAEFTRTQGSFSIRERDVVLAALARLGLAVGEAPVVAKFLAHHLPARDAELFAPASISLHILHALACSAAGENTAATASSFEALRLAVTHELPGCICAEGPRAIDLIQSEVQRQGIARLPSGHVDFVGRLLARRHGIPERAALSASFTPREYEILRGLAQGLSNKRIARPLGLSEETIKWHLRKLYAKLGVGDRHLAVRVAQEFSLLG